MRSASSPSDMTLFPQQGRDRDAVGIEGRLESQLLDRNDPEVCTAVPSILGSDALSGASTGNKWH